MSLAFANGTRLFSPAGQKHAHRGRGMLAFTMIEIMVVVAIMGIVLTMGVPIVFKVRNREALNQSVRDVVEVLNNARARAILQGKMAEVVLHPKERMLEVSGGGIPSPKPEGVGFDVEHSGVPSDSGLVAQIPEKVSVEMMDVNLIEYKDQEYGRVRFHPNGTCDEFTLILRSEKGEWIKIWLEATTSLANVGPVDR